MPPDVRLGRPSDAAAMARIESSSFPDPWPEEVFAECLGRGSGVRTWLAMDGGRVAGYLCAVDPVPGTLHIVNICVTRARRRRGIGSALLDIAERWGATMGAEWSFLEVRNSNRAAIGLYAGRGYVPCENLRSYYGEGRHGLRLARRLPPLPGGRLRAALAEKLRGVFGAVPPVGVVLGSGLSWIAGIAGAGSSCPWGSLPGMSGDGVPGHPGMLSVSGCGRFVFIQGRRHRYQGWDAGGITLLPGVLADLGTHTWLLTSSAGAVSGRFHAGGGMVFADHVNLSGCIPQSGVRLQDPVYSRALRDMAADCAALSGADVGEGVFACVSGPQYETAAELRLLRARGVDAVSMSTATEALALRAAGCDILGLALLTNQAEPGADVTHDRVLAAQASLETGLRPFITLLLGRLADHGLR